MKVLGYSKWEHFTKLINRAMVSCKMSGFAVNDHFPLKGKIVKSGVTAKEIVDYKLSRYASYLIIQNAEPRKEVSALGQNYFVVQTRKMEITQEAFSKLTEEEKRL